MVRSQGLLAAAVLATRRVVTWTLRDRGWMMAAQDHCTRSEGVVSNGN